MKPDILLIDNKDSFSFNLVESFERLDFALRVFRHSIDARRAFAIARDAGAWIVLSPGPGRPRDAGCCLELIALAKYELPLLGICLGHQAIVEEAGGIVCRAPEPVHGKASLLVHDGTGPFLGMTAPVRVGRYHSLCTPDPPARFHVHGRIEGMAMAISDPDALQTGLQFHPESILTPQGDAMLGNILAGMGRMEERPALNACQ
jgi:anthranilate synthase/aminodeoxychorismate synthase-like glutamine amidotransferase